MITDVLKTQRALCALSQISPDKVPDAITALYHAFWVEGQEISKPDVIAAVLGKAPFTAGPVAVTLWEYLITVCTYRTWEISRQLLPHSSLI